MRTVYLAVACATVFAGISDASVLLTGSYNDPNDWVAMGAPGYSFMLSSTQAIIQKAAGQGVGESVRLQTVFTVSGDFDATIEVNALEAPWDSDIGIIAFNSAFDAELFHHEEEVAHFICTGISDAAGTQCTATPLSHDLIFEIRRTGNTLFTGVVHSGEFNRTSTSPNFGGPITFGLFMDQGPMTHNERGTGVFNNLVLSGTNTPEPQSWMFVLSGVLLLAAVRAARGRREAKRASSR